MRLCDTDLNVSLTACSFTLGVMMLLVQEKCTNFAFFLLKLIWVKQLGPQNNEFPKMFIMFKISKIFNLQYYHSRAVALAINLILWSGTNNLCCINGFEIF